MPIRLRYAIRAPAIAVLTCSLAALGGGCSEPVRVQSFLPGPHGSFTYSVRTNTVMPPNEDSGAETIRRYWLAQTLAAAGMCGGGYVIYNRQLVVPPQRVALPQTPPPPPLGPDNSLSYGDSGDVVYNGSCL
jgi:hypothetical protein